ncbi:MAG: hypothetical protein HQL46_12830, partial [Gammaproteobacteria bacterium]|nr:hypothetical protein [Gammaproteobacteria bacterium]
TFPSEDLNDNGILDVGEDNQTINGILDPGNVAAVPRTVITGDDGTVEFDIVYAKNYGGYVDFELTAATNVAGTEFIDSLRDTLPVAASDVNSENKAPPGQVSKWEETTRTLNFGTATETIETTVNISNGTAACDGYF